VFSRNVHWLRQLRRHLHPRSGYSSLQLSDGSLDEVHGHDEAVFLDQEIELVRLLYQRRGPIQALPLLLASVFVEALDFGCIDSALVHLHH
jgi:hypothetical protein